MSRLHYFLATAAGLMLLAVGLSGCPSVGQDPPVDFSYETEPIAIYNADWGVLPLANNFLNPAFQATIPVAIPGVPAPDEMPETVVLPVVDDAAAEAAQALGYPVEPDGELTQQLKAGMNKLDGFVPGFVVRVPFSKPVDMTSLVPAEGTIADGVLTEGNADVANFFFLDITDAENPVLIPPADYYRIFNMELAQSYPYMLTLRLTPAILLPRDYTPGHTYLVVATGLDEDRGLKDDEAKAFWPDSFFCLFNGADPYISPEGVSRNNLLTDLGAVQELEGARQITNYGVSIWEKLVGEGRDRSEIVSAFHFSIASNPMPMFFTPLKAVQGNNPIVPSPSDYARIKDDGSTEIVKAKTCTTTEIKFSINMPVDLDGVTGEAVKLWKKTGADAYEEVAVDIAAAHEDTTDANTADPITVTRVTLTPKAALDADSDYMVAMDNSLRGGLYDRKAVDEVYFGLTRVKTPLIIDGVWQSPYLDSRVDTLILNGTTEDITTDDLATAEVSMVSILTVLEATRKHFEPGMDWLVADGFVFEREDITLFFTFSTGADACADSGN
jgi:hypothetical protein